MRPMPSAASLGNSATNVATEASATSSGILRSKCRHASSSTTHRTGSRRQSPLPNRTALPLISTAIGFAFRSQYNSVGCERSSRRFVSAHRLNESSPKKLCRAAIVASSRFGSWTCRRGRSSSLEPSKRVSRTRAEDTQHGLSFPCRYAYSTSTTLPSRPHCGKSYGRTVRSAEPFDGWCEVCEWITIRG